MPQTPQPPKSLSPESLKTLNPETTGLLRPMSLCRRTSNLARFVPVVIPEALNPNLDSDVFRPQGAGLVSVLRFDFTVLL